MAIQKKPQEVREVEDYTPLITSEGDGLNPLRVVQQQYYTKANKIVAKCTDPVDGTIDPFYVDLAGWYRTQGDNVKLLIAQV